MPATSAIEPNRVHRTAITAGLLVGLAVLLFGQDDIGLGPYVLVGLAFFVAVHGYLRTRPRGPSECNDEP